MNNTYKYFHTDSVNVRGLSEEEITKKYSEGYLFTRNKNIMNQTRSLRINLAEFQLTSENRRILRKNEDIEIVGKSLPLENYFWKYHAFGKEYYSQKFGEGTMSASKIKEMFQEPQKSNMNYVFMFISTIHNSWEYKVNNRYLTGLCLSYQNLELVHYAYPFYNLNIEKSKSIGLSMMIKTVDYSLSKGKKFIYLGSVTNKSAFYKLQFKGLEWWDENHWNKDTDRLVAVTKK